MIKIVGDICYADWYFDEGIGIGSQINKGFDPFSSLSFDKNDFLIGNMECVISDVSNNTNKYFRLNTNSFRKFKYVNLYSVANNHILEHGVDAYESTKKSILSNNSNFVGCLSRKTTKFKYNSRNIGIMSFSLRKDPNSENVPYWNKPEFSDIAKEFKEIANTDFKILYLHWGNEFINYPNEEQKRFAHWLIDLGFDLIVGCHPHVLQGYEKYKGKYIYYSLGNFLFNMPTNQTRISAMVNIDIENEEFVVSHTYVGLSNNNMIEILDEINCPKEFTFETLNKNLKKCDDNEVYYRIVFKNIKAFRRSNHVKIIKNFAKQDKRLFFRMLCKFFRRQIKKKC